MTWFRVLAPCPRCKRLPAIRLNLWLIIAATDAPADKPLLDYQCQNDRCTDEKGRRTTYVIAAHAIQRAEPIKRRDAA